VKTGRSAEKTEFWPEPTDGVPANFLGIRRQPFLHFLFSVSFQLLHEAVPYLAVLPGEGVSFAFALSHKEAAFW